MFVQSTTAHAHLPPGLLAASCMPADASATRNRTLAAGAALFREGDGAESIYALVSGVVRLSKALPDDRRQIVGFVFPRQIFTSSGFALAREGLATCTADAVTLCQMTVYQRNELDRLLEERPNVARSMLAASSRCLYLAQQQMLLLGRMSAIERVSWFLLMMARQQNVEGDASLHLPMNRLDIADYLGLAIETVSRTLCRLRDNRFIEVPSAAEIRIRDWAGIRRVASCST